MALASKDNILRFALRMVITISIFHFLATQLISITAIPSGVEREFQRIEEAIGGPPTVPNDPISEISRTAILTPSYILSFPLILMVPQGYGPFGIIMMPLWVRVLNSICFAFTATFLVTLLNLVRGPERQEAPIMGIDFKSIWSRLFLSISKKANQKASSSKHIFYLFFIHFLLSQSVRYVLIADNIGGGPPRMFTSLAVLITGFPITDLVILHDSIATARFDPIATLMERPFLLLLNSLVVTLCVCILTDLVRRSRSAARKKK